MARPSIFTKALGDKICHRIAQGESVRKIELDDKMPSGVTIYHWLLDGKHGLFLKQYAQARNIQSERLFEELQEIADGSDDIIRGDDKSDSARVQAKKLRVDTLKWRLSKLVPKKYGDKLDLTSDGKALPSPILGGVAAKHEIQENNSGK